MGTLKINGYFNTQRKFEIETATEFEKALNEKLSELPGLKDPKSFALKTASVTAEKISQKALDELAQEVFHKINFDTIEKVALQASASDLTGEIILKITFWPTDKSLANFHHEIKIGGFAKLTPEQVDKVSEAKEWVKSPFKPLDKLAREVVKNNKLLREMLGIEEFEKKIGFKLEFKINARKTNETTGDLWFDYQVYDGETLLTEGSAHWKLLSVEEYQRLVDTLTQSIENWNEQNLRDKFDWVKDTMPSEFVKEDQERNDRIKKFLEEHVLPWKEIGRRLTWEIDYQSTPNDEKGYVNLVVLIQDEDKIIKSIHLKLTGFRTEAERDADFQKSFWRFNR
ncbi:lipoprotein 17-related variable surface protein [Mycoplasma sp. ATU-Cv-508]|uniref:lipoprotein 17-related variable surface protein n=1 Tax=Mycoplasma sp. ATU-Cv-508 TaxID=2048001 RepID=UPI000FDE123B